MTTEQAKKKIEELEPIQAKLWEEVKKVEAIYIEKQKVWSEVYSPLRELKEFVRISEANP